MPGVLCSQVCGLFGAGHMPRALYRHFYKTLGDALLDRVDPVRSNTRPFKLWASALTKHRVVLTSFVCWRRG
jgi:hypothetical protein